MQPKVCIVLMAFFVMGISSMALSEMSSDNYRVTTKVVSGAGGPMGSADYQLNGTVGQPSPLMDPLEPPLSENYDMYPGFWNVVVAFESTCPGDFNGDRDVDGSDLADYIIDSDGLGLEAFATDFGKTNCPE